VPRQTPIMSNLVLLHTRVGFDLLVDPNDYLSALLSKDGVYEAPETDLVARIVRTGDICIDAGCHLGYYSCLFAKLVGNKGRVYSFDASPYACLGTKRNLGLNGFCSANVMQVALADTEGTRPFHVSADDQTGLSSLGAIPNIKETILVRSSPLEAFLEDQCVERVRLLKLDVEGAEEMVLRGLGSFLVAHLIDYILIECFDERLQLLESSTKKITDILKSAGYKPWGYGMENQVGWSQAAEVRSRGDCNYLFSSPALAEQIPTISLAAALDWTQARRDDLLKQSDQLVRENSTLKMENDRLVREDSALKLRLEKLQDDTDWLLESIKTHEQKSARHTAETAQLVAEKAIWDAVQRSVSWRMLNKWRSVQNRLVPAGSFRRNVYDSLIAPLRKRRPSKSKAEGALPPDRPAEVETNQLRGVQMERVEVIEPSAWIRRLAEKWQEIPTTAMGRGSSLEQLRLSDTAFLSWWDGLEREVMSQQQAYWVIEVYRDFVRGKKMIEVGPGTGIIGVQFLRAGAQITFMDVVESNLKLVERVCRLKGIEGASFFPIYEFRDPLKVPDDYDVVLARGSLHHTPADVVKPEFEALASRIKVGGRFLALTYPKERWAREGSKTFNEWGKNTDGDTTPWAEWYDTEKLLAQLSPFQFRTLMAFNLHNDDFNWFDLQRM